MHWWGWATFGFVATVVLTGIMVAAQLAGLSRMDIPMMPSERVSRANREGELMTVTLFECAGCGLRIPRDPTRNPGRVFGPHTFR